MSAQQNNKSDGISKNPAENPSTTPTRRPPRPSGPPPDKETISLPAPKETSIYDRKLTASVVTGTSALLAGLAKVVPDWLTDTFTVSTFIGWVALTMAAIGTGLALRKAKIEDDAAAADALDASDYHSMLVMLREIMVQEHLANGLPCRCKEAHLMRVTIYRVEGEDAIQVLKHVGGPGGAVNRKLPAKSGIVWRAMRDSESIYSKRQSKDLTAYRRQLVHDFNFSPEYAKSVREDRWAWAAMPIMRSEEVVAVVYADSGDADFFDDKQNLFASACAGLAEYARIR